MSGQKRKHSLPGLCDKKARSMGSMECPILSVPQEIIQYILLYCDFKSLALVGQTCRPLYELSRDDVLINARLLISRVDGPPPPKEVFPLSFSKLELAHHQEVEVVYYPCIKAIETLLSSGILRNGVPFIYRDFRINGLYYRRRPNINDIQHYKLYLKSLTWDISQNRLLPVLSFAQNEVTADVAFNDLIGIALDLHQPSEISSAREGFMEIYESDESDDEEQVELKRQLKRDKSGESLWVSLQYPVVSLKILIDKLSYYYSKSLLRSKQ